MWLIWIFRFVMVVLKLKKRGEEPLFFAVFVHLPYFIVIPMGNPGCYVAADL